MSTQVQTVPRPLLVRAGHTAPPAGAGAGPVDPDGVMPPVARGAGGGRPVGRPRDVQLDRAIRAAVVELLAGGGPGAASLDDVAARAGVGKATIYRRWPTKHRLIGDVVTGLLPVPAPSVDQGSLSGDADALLHRLAELLTTQQALAVRQLLPQIERWPGLADELRRGILDPWQDRIHAIAARHRGDRGEADQLSTEIALRSAALALCAEWMLDAQAFVARHPTLTRSRVEELVANLLSNRSSA